MELNVQNKVNWKDSAVVFIILTVLVLFVFSLIQYLFSILLEGPVGSWIGIAITEFGIAGVVLIWVKYKVKGDLTDFGLEKPSLKWVIAALLLGVITFFGVVLIINIQNLIFPIPEWWAEAYSEVLIGSVNPLVYLIWIIFMWIIVAPCEELAFRGLIQNGFENKWEGRGKLVYLAPVITGILFGLFHLDPFRIIPIAVMGIVVSLVYHKSRNLPTAVIFHAAYNSVTYLLLILLSLLPQTS